MSSFALLFFFALWEGGDGLVSTCLETLNGSLFLTWLKLLLPLLEDWSSWLPRVLFLLSEFRFDLRE
jgi:hypothetical protein